MNKNKYNHKRHEYRQTIKRIIMWSSATLVVVISFFGLLKLSEKEPEKLNGNTASLTEQVNESDRIKGVSTAPVTLVEYSDFQCPACAQYHGIILKLQQELGDSLQFVYRNYPLRQIHINADLAARAAEAAGSQGKYWEMHDAIFQTQETWSEKDNAESIFIELATSLELNIDQFRTDLQSDTTKEKIQRDYTSGVDSGVTSTPTFFVNGEKIKNPQSYDDFKSILQEKISSGS